MPFALLIIGIVLIVAGVRNTQGILFTLLKGDFTGNGNFIFWFVSILLIGSIGYIEKLKPLSTAFLVLVLMALFLSKGDPSKSGGGFFKQFSTALGGTQGAGGITDYKSAIAGLENQNNQIRDILSNPGFWNINF